VKKIISVLCIFVLLIGITACGGRASGDSWVMYEREMMAMSPPAAAPAPPAPGMGLVAQTAADSAFRDDGGTAAAPAVSRMVIQTANMSIESAEEDFGDTMAALQGLPDRFGGFIEASNLNNFTRMDIYGNERQERFFSAIIRVPVGYFDAAMAYISGLAELTAQNIFAEDITDRFYDMAGRLETRRLEETRILALIGEAETLDQLLNLESRLTQVRTQIRRYESQMDNMADRAALSTIHVSLSHIQIAPIPPEPAGLFARIGQGFSGSASGTANFFTNALLVLARISIPALAIAVFTVVVVRVALKLSRRPAPPPEQAAE